MHLVVARHAAAVGPMHEARTAHAIRARCDRHATADQRDRVLARDAGEEGLLGTLTVDLACSHLVGGTCAENAEVLGEQHELRALRCRSGDQRLGLREIRRDVPARHHLHRRDAHQRAFASETLPGIVPLSARDPSRSICGSDHEPRTAYS